MNNDFEVFVMPFGTLNDPDLWAISEALPQSCIETMAVVIAAHISQGYTTKPAIRANIEEGLNSGMAESVDDVLDMFDGRFPKLHFWTKRLDGTYGLRIFRRAA